MTLGYDTIYGFQDIKDDEIIGLKSTSIKFKGKEKIFIRVLLTFNYFFLAGGYLMNFHYVIIYYYYFLWLIYFFQIKNFNQNNHQVVLKHLRVTTYLD